MAKKQTRRTISINRAVYDKLAQEAATRGVSHSELVVVALRAIGIDVPGVRHESSTAIAKMRRKKGYVAPKRPSLERQMLGDDIADRLGFQ